MVKTKIQCKNQDEVEEMLEKVKVLFKGEDLVVTDGVKVLLPQSWVHVRASNTEPVIRVIAEGKKKQDAEDLIEQVFNS